MSGKNKKDGKKSEENCECCTASPDGKTCPPIRNVTHPLRYYEFTQDELKALEECDIESFYRRCLPFSTLFATLTYAAVKMGHLKRNPHFGAVPKMLVAGILGYAYGRVSYLNACDERLRQLPANSPLGNLMRRYHAQANTPPPSKK